MLCCNLLLILKQSNGNGKFSWTTEVKILVDVLRRLCNTCAQFGRLRELRTDVGSTRKHATQDSLFGPIWYDSLLIFSISSKAVDQTRERVQSENAKKRLLKTRKEKNELDRSCWFTCKDVLRPKALDLNECKCILEGAGEQQHYTQQQIFSEWGEEKLKTFRYGNGMLIRHAFVRFDPKRIKGGEEGSMKGSILWLSRVAALTALTMACST